MQVRVIASWRQHSFHPGLKSASREPGVYSPVHRETQLSWKVLTLGTLSTMLTQALEQLHHVLITMLNLTVMKYLFVQTQKRNNSCRFGGDIPRGSEVCANQKCKFQRWSQDFRGKKAVSSVCNFNGRREEEITRNYVNWRRVLESSKGFFIKIQACLHSLFPTCTQIKVGHVRSS